jgi:predicted enzyme related to lactoylglutathione lyase
MAFCRETLGRTFERFELPGGAFWVAKAGETLVGGIGGLDTAAELGASQSAWTAFVRVDDTDRRMTRAIGLGANALQAPHDVPNVGRVAVLRDPTGAVIGWLQ